MMKAKYKRILLKLSGESLMGKGDFGICQDTLGFVGDEIKKLVATGAQIGVVIGAGNIFRGVSMASKGMNRVAADNMGMLATVMNALALEAAFNKQGIETRVMSSIAMPQVCESYSRQRAEHHLNRDRVVIFGAGSGNPYFTTDTAAVLRGLEIGAEVVMKATRVDGVYDRDPLKDPQAVKFDALSYSETLQRRLKVMDSTAISLAMDNDIKIMVFNLHIKNSIADAVCGQNIGTIIQGDSDE
ncbi:Uridine monophosphate kinase [hydrothermal vent metagenome]|uniref:Uridylate kinase n=1 Tax=hydrothermal vent metagenome TaxID=652676 RepID=A0A3B0VNH5_9ZZZZ